MMHKIIMPDSWDFGEPSAEIVKVSSEGLRGSDLKAFLKRASHSFSSQLDNIKIAKDEIPVHLIAIGATEYYSANRNGDGFKEATCRRYHDDFVKHSKVYKSHINQDPARSYGVVKASAYNDDMHRIELLVAINEKQSAADRNGGLVDKKMVEDLYNGKTASYSMSCRVSHDVCSSCGNKAKTRKDYCDEDSCVGSHGEKRGGCKRNLAKVAYDGHILHVDNPYPRFFDISDVVRPADRIAYGAVADYLQKAASGDVLGGAALAEAHGLGFSVNFNHNTTKQLKLAYELADIENRINEASGLQQKRYEILATSATNNTIDISEFTHKQAEAITALAEQHVVLPLSAFLSAENCENKEAEVRDRLPGVYSRITGSDYLSQLIENNEYTAQISGPALRYRDWACKLASDCSLRENRVSQRVHLAAINGTQAKPLRKSSELVLETTAERLAWKYALCKLAMLSAMTDVTDSMLETAIIDHYGK